MKNSTFVFSVLLSNNGVNCFKSIYSPVVTIQYAANGLIKVFDEKVCFSLTTSQTGWSAIQASFIGLNLSYSQLIQENIS